jgi:hypothetical protein
LPSHALQVPNLLDSGRVLLDFQMVADAFGEEEDQDYDAEFKAALDDHVPAIIHLLAHDGPVLCHCVSCGVDHVHLIDDKCPILNEKGFPNSFVICAGSACHNALSVTLLNIKKRLVALLTLEALLLVTSSFWRH